MNCCTAPEVEEPKSPSERSDRFGFFNVFNSAIATAGVKPLEVTTRGQELTKETIMKQQQSARDLARATSDVSLSNLPRASFSHQPLREQPRAHRMSRIGSISRGKLVKSIEEAAKVASPTKVSHAQGAGLLLERLHSLGMASVEMEGDGNCQVRSPRPRPPSTPRHDLRDRRSAVTPRRLSDTERASRHHALRHCRAPEPRRAAPTHQPPPRARAAAGGSVRARQFRALADQLFGSQEHHAVVRALAIAHMRSQSDFFSMFYESPSEFNAYLKDMARNRTWGDELTLRASVEAFGCKAHVITSEGANWYLVYTPETPPDEQVLAKACAKYRLKPPKQNKEVFINCARALPRTRARGAGARRNADTAPWSDCAVASARRQTSRPSTTMPSKRGRRDARCSTPTSRRCCGPSHPGSAARAKVSSHSGCSRVRARRTE
jgi:hypothetical protein